MPAHAQQPHHFSCCRALTRTALYQLPVGETTWVKLREKEATQEEKGEKARNTNLKTKAPHRDVRKQNNLMSCVMMF